jgi:hypothetical protein
MADQIKFPAPLRPRTIPHDRLSSTAALFMPHRHIRRADGRFRELGKHIQKTSLAAAAGAKLTQTAAAPSIAPVVDDLERSPSETNLHTKAS